jgi:hypothetical protein
MFALKKIQQRYPCPVCGYALERPPTNFNICPSCGVEFGYHDAGRLYIDLRQEWVNSGAHWSSRVDRKPMDWNPWVQLITVGYSYVVPFWHQVKIESGPFPVSMILGATPVALNAGVQFGLQVSA